MHMRRAVHGMDGLVGKQLEEVTWTCSNTQEITDAQNFDDDFDDGFDGIDSSDFNLKLCFIHFHLYPSPSLFLLPMSVILFPMHSFFLFQ